MPGCIHFSVVLCCAVLYALRSKPSFQQGQTPPTAAGTQRARATGRNLKDQLDSRGTNEHAAHYTYTRRTESRPPTCPCGALSRTCPTYSPTPSGIPASNDISTGGGCALREGCGGAEGAEGQQRAATCVFSIINGSQASPSFALNSTLKTSLYRFPTQTTAVRREETQNPHMRATRLPTR